MRSAGPRGQSGLVAFLFGIERLAIEPAMQVPTSKRLMNVGHGAASALSRHLKRASMARAANRYEHGLMAAQLIQRRLNARPDRL